MSLLDELIDAETAVWQALVDGDAQADAGALDDDFLGVYGDGFAGKADHVGQLADGPTMAAFDLSHTRAMPLGREHAMLSYRAEFTRTGVAEPEVMFVSSVWKRTSASWVNIFSQDTPAT